MTMVTSRSLHDPDHRDFASDSCADLPNRVLAAIAATIGGHQISYGRR
jgi:hypothetical protein